MDAGSADGWATGFEVERIRRLAIAVGSAPNSGTRSVTRRRSAGDLRSRTRDGFDHSRPVGTGLGDPATTIRPSNRPRATSRLGLGRPAARIIGNATPRLDRRNATPRAYGRCREMGLFRRPTGRRRAFSVAAGRRPQPRPPRGLETPLTPRNPGSWITSPHRDLN